MATGKLVSKRVQGHLRKETSRLDNIASIDAKQFGDLLEGGGKTAEANLVELNAGKAVKHIIVLRGVPEHGLNPRGFPYAIVNEMLPQRYVHPEMKGITSKVLESFNVAEHNSHGLSLEMSGNSTKHADRIKKIFGDAYQRKLYWIRSDDKSDYLVDSLRGLVRGCVVIDTKSTQQSQRPPI